MMDQNEILREFGDTYGGKPVLTRSPGRINLIGEHTDYNDGFVLPGAIDKEVILAVKSNDKKKIRIVARDLKQSVEVPHLKLSRHNKRWPNYLLGIADQLQKAGYEVPGFDCVFGSNIPIGAGLSSSAAIECGLAFSLNQIFGFGLNRIELAKISLKAEHEFAGVKCGIMDQFANLFGKKNHVIKLDCRSLEYKYFPLELENHEIILCDTQVKHSLAASEYNTRRRECEEGVEMIRQKNNDIQNLRDVSPEMITPFEKTMSQKVFQRCMYVTSENRRVEMACQDLEGGDIKSFGDKMFDTHFGLSEMYEVSCAELDYLVRIALQSGVTGARMMGGGFGGCTINLIARNEAEKFINNIQVKYPRKFQKEPLIYRVNIEHGTSLI